MTIRDRDTTEQVRVPIADVVDTVSGTRRVSDTTVAPMTTYLDRILEQHRASAAADTRSLDALSPRPRR